MHSSLDRLLPCTGVRAGDENANQTESIRILDERQLHDAMCKRRPQKRDLVVEIVESPPFVRTRELSICVRAFGDIASR